MSWAFPNSLKRFDLVIQKGHASIGIIIFEDAALSRSGLPVKYGEIGVRSLELLARFTFLVLVNSARSLLSKAGHANVGPHSRRLRISGSK